MTEIKEKLVELIDDALQRKEGTARVVGKRYVDTIADHLIAHGVTVSNLETVALGLPKTNADRVRAMSDEVMVDLIFTLDLDGKINFCEERPECVAACEQGELNPYGRECRKCLLKWLKQPAKEG